MPKASLDTVTERLDGLKEYIGKRLDSQDARLGNIEEHVERTNGRVSSLEGWRNRLVGAGIVLSTVSGYLFKLIMDKR